MNYFYLLIALALQVLSAISIADKNADLLKGWKPRLLAAFLTSVFFTIVSSLLLYFQAFSFNPKHITGLNILNLPVDEFIFYLSMSFAGLNIYSWLNKRFPDNGLEKFSLSFSNLIIGILIASLFFCYSKLYSAVVFSVLIFLLLYVEYGNSLRFMYRFYRAYLLLLIPLFASYSLIMHLQILNYSEGKINNLKVGAVQLEVFIFFMSVLLLSVYLYEVLKSRRR